MLIYTRDEHPPAHVHVRKAGGEAVIYLGDENSRPSVKENRGMSRAEIKRALRITGENQELLLAEWERING